MHHQLIRTVIVCSFLLPISTFGTPTFQSAKPGCKPKCGNVTIPFPFGLGPVRCFLDEWFEIGCDQNATVPVLRKLNLQVLNISLPAYYTANSTAASETTYGLHDGTVKVNLPIVRHQCDGARPSPPNVSLRSSPYSFSQPGNFLATVGCNNLAVMAETASAFVGCASHCDGGGLGNFSNCSGVGCCRTSIPSGLREFDVTFKRISDHDTVAVGEECRLAFLADKQWLEFNESKDLRMLREMEYVPGVLEWGIPKEMTSAIGLGGSDSYGCENYGEPESERLPKLYRCYCRSGYVGNAYLADCQGKATLIINTSYIIESTCL
ncbi:hypothetical protein NL676_017218 [Syzygium grande]|nr:hypothetical protein NL676_017218 [Syzygium grande]